MFFTATQVKPDDTVLISQYTVPQKTVQNCFVRTSSNFNQFW